MHDHTQIASLFAITTALCWAIGTYAAGRASIKVSSKLLVIFYNIASATYFIIASNFAFNNISTKFIIYSILAGIGHASSLSLVGYALSKGRSGVIAPVSTILEIAIPVVVTTFVVARLGWLSYFGILILISSIWLLRKADNSTHETTVFTDIVYGMLIGAGFGSFITFTSLVDNAHKHNAFFIAQISSMTLMIILLMISKLKFKKKIGVIYLKQKNIIIPAFIFASLELVGAISLNHALARGNVGIVSALASIPFTLGLIAISVILLKEKLTKLQFTGIAIATIGIAITHLSTM